MRNTTPYQFVGTDTEALLSELSEQYTAITGRELHDADPEYIFLRWVASVIVAERVKINFVGNQNIPSRAVGENLDALGEFVYGVKRAAPGYAHATEKFTISEPQGTVIAIKKGTRVTDPQKKHVWETTAEAEIAVGQTTVEVPIICQTAGTAPNGTEVGTITQLIDVDNVLYYTSCTNTTSADGGFDAPTDDEYYELLRASLEALSTAGPRGSYEYHARAVSTEIADVRAVNPSTEYTGTVTVSEDADGNRLAYIGGDGLDIDTLKVGKVGGAWATVETDYTFEYADGLVTITITDTGVLKDEDTVAVAVRRKNPCDVRLFVLMDDAEDPSPSQEIKDAVLAACNDASVRPLTDWVYVDEADAVGYNITLTYYRDANASRSADEISVDVNEAVQNYIAWQRERFGRDINPSKLTGMIMDVDGVKRVSVYAPTYTVLSDGYDGTTPEYAMAGTVAVTDGGAERE